jgi:hypothetical protein
MARDDEFNDRSRRPGDADDDPPRPRKGNAGPVIGILVGVWVLCRGGGGFLTYLAVQGTGEGIDNIVGVAQDTPAGWDR